MALINITPKMTSDTTPAPYRCWASSVWSDAYPAYKAFDGDTTGLSYWHNGGTESKEGTLYFDFGKPVTITDFEIYPGNNGSYKPGIITIYGSIGDGSTTEEFEQIQSYSVSDSAYNPTKIFTITNLKAYRTYKIYVFRNDYNMSVQEIVFYQDEERVFKTLTQKIKEVILNNKYFTDNIVRFNIDKGE